MRKPLLATTLLALVVLGGGALYSPAEHLAVDTASPYLEYTVLRTDTGPCVADASACSANVESSEQSSGSPAPNAMTLTGVVTIDGAPAPQSVTVSARIGDKTCGTTTVGENGAYRLSVSPADAEEGCGTPSAAVTLAVTPRFGDGWRERTPLSFLAGGTVERELAVDLKALVPNFSNIPTSNIFWFNPQSIRIGVCARMSPDAIAATASAIEMWREAFRSGGLRTEIVRDDLGACDDDLRGIAIFEATIARRGVIAAQFFFDINRKNCDFDGPVTCIVLFGGIAINGPTLRQLSPDVRAASVAHEIGHALGLLHAKRCTGGTVMWEDTRCEFPLRGIGVDDIAALNTRVQPNLAAPSDRAGGAWESDVRAP